MEQPSVLKTSLNYGALSGLACFVFFLVLGRMVSNPLGISSWLGAWIPIVFMVLSTKHFRDHDCGGYITYWSAFRAGFMTAVAGGFLFALLVYAYGMVIDADLVERFKEENLRMIEESAQLSKSMFGEALYEKSIESLQQTTISTIASQEFMNKSLGGLLVALVTGAIFRKQQPTIQS